MTKEEEILHAQIHLSWIEKQQADALANLDRLLTFVESDPYAELKAAHAAGKRIAIKSICRGESTYILANRPMWDGFVKDYKIIEDDEIDKLIIHLQKLNQRVEVRFTKCGLTGNITAEVVNG